MKILHVDTQKCWRGGEQQLFWLVENLKKNGIDSAVACKKDEALYNRCKEEKINTIPLSGNQLKDIFKIAYEGKNFDIVHAHAAKAHTISAFAKIINKKSLIYTRRVDYKPKNNPITGFKYKNTDKIIAISEFVASVLKNFLKSDDVIDVIYSAVDTAIKDRVDNRKVENIRHSLGGAPIIGSVAALSKQKNIPNFIKAASYVIKRFDNAVFVVLGEGELKEKLELVIKNEGLENRFKLLGFKKDVENYIKSFDIFVLPSDFEGLGSSLLSAMILDIPVVATDAGGISEVVKNKETGFLVEKNNPKELAEKIIELIENESLKKQLIKTAKGFVLHNFSVEKMTHEYIKIYKELYKN